MELILRVLLTVSTAAGFGYGVCICIGKKTALFKKLVTYAFGCFMLGRIYEIITYIITGGISSVFHIGMLSVIGGFLFICSASYGQMDGLVDDRTKMLMKYRILALTAPLMLYALFLPAALSTDGNKRIVAFAVTTAVALASYYNLKHLVIPDVSFGIIKSIRGYNLCSLILELSYVLQLTAEKTDNDSLWTASSILLILICPLVIPVMERGSRKWTV